MKIAEPLLRKGNVYIAARCPLLLVATFIDKKGSQVTVHSDKGLDHLLMLLVGKVGNNNSLVEKANKNYRYALSIVHTDQKVNVLEKSYTKFSYNEKGYRVSIRQITVPSLKSIPGIYWRKAYGTTLKEAFAAAVDTTPVLQV